MKKTTMITRMGSSGLIGRRGVLKAAGGLAAIGLTGTVFGTAAFAQSGMVALVHTQAAGDNGPVDSMIARLKQLAGERGFEYRAVYAQDPATYETIFRTLGEAGASIVVSTFPGVSEPFKAVAPQFPDTKWIQLFGDAFDPAIDNVVTVSYDYYLGCYLSGIFAANVTQTGKLGFIGGISIPPINADFNAFKAGAQSVRSDISAVAAFAGSFQDPAKGLEIANQMYTDGIDFIQTDAAATDGGIIAAANEKEGRMVSALDPAQYELGPASVISIVGLDFGASLYNEVTKALGDAWAGGSHTATGLGTGVIDFMRSPVFQEKGPDNLNARATEVWAQIEQAKSGILDGSVSVPFNTEI